MQGRQKKKTGNPSFDRPGFLAKKTNTLNNLFRFFLVVKKAGSLFL